MLPQAVVKVYDSKRTAFNDETGWVYEADWNHLCCPCDPPDTPTFRLLRHRIKRDAAQIHHSDTGFVKRYNPQRVVS